MENKPTIDPMMNPNVRKSKVLIDGEWKDIHMLDIKKGMVFKTFEPDGTPVEVNGISIFTAISDSFIREDGIVQTEIAYGD